MYQIIPRKYRPQSFKKIVGQNAIVATLKNALLHDLLAQAYLFCGGKGTGKTTLARLFAKALNCAHLTPDQEPCNTCPSCIDTTSGRSLDVLEIDGASNRGIDDIRQINETVGYAPTSGKYKIYIIDEVHMLTKEAFNALLKTLEEPPQHVKFFFATTEPHKVLPTIISRCQRFDLHRISKDAMREKLLFIISDLKASLEPKALDILIEMSEGSLRDAESLLDQLICSAEGPITVDTMTATFGITPTTLYLDLDKAIIAFDLPFAYELADQIFSSGNDLAAFMDGLIGHYRSKLKDLIKNKDINSPFSLEQCLYIIEYLVEWGYKLAKTPFKHAGLEIILLHLIRSKKRVSIDTLVHQLMELENKIPAEKELRAYPEISSESEIIPEQALTALKDVPCPVKQQPVTPPQEAPCAAPLPEAEKLEQKIKTKPPGSSVTAKSHYDTLIRFAAVELEGITER
ncbi:MAG: DNA polymerase III subunit gamma/tau [Chlamydiota bacterium]